MEQDDSDEDTETTGRAEELAQLLTGFIKGKKSSPAQKKRRKKSPSRWTKCCDTCRIICGLPVILLVLACMAIGGLYTNSSLSHGIKLEGHRPTVWPENSLTNVNDNYITIPWQYGLAFVWFICCIIAILLIVSFFSCIRATITYFCKCMCPRCCCRKKKEQVV